MFLHSSLYRSVSKSARSKIVQSVSEVMWLLVIFSILWRDKHEINTLSFPCITPAESPPGNCRWLWKLLCAVLYRSWDKSSTHRESSTQVFLWRRSGTPWGPVLQRWVQAVCVSLHKCLSVCVFLSLAALQRSSSSHQNTHTKLILSLAIYLSIYIYINICISLLSDSPASLRFEIRHLAETLLRADVNVRLVWFEKTWKQLFYPLYNKSDNDLAESFGLGNEKQHQFVDFILLFYSFMIIYDNISIIYNYLTHLQRRYWCLLTIHCNYRSVSQFCISKFNFQERINLRPESISAICRCILAKTIYASI